MEARRNGKCALCGKETWKVCGKCKKTFYCTPEHRDIHLKAHKEDCYPCEVKYNSELGYHLVATKAVPVGEIIFKEKPLLFAPNGRLLSLKQICLGCCELVNSSATCSTCGWPLCTDPICENASQHVDFECKILAANKIPTPKEPWEFEIIGIIRCLILKNDPEIWEKITTLLPHGDAAMKHQSQVIRDETQVFRIVKKICKMKDVDLATVKTICKAINNATYCADRFAARNGYQVYYMTSKISRQCIPNVRVLDEDPDFAIRKGKERLWKKPEFQLSVMATKDIQKGDVLNLFFQHSFLGTIERRNYLFDHFNFHCSCPRCRDSTDLGTYLSAVKCTRPECMTLSKTHPRKGYYLPIDPLDGLSYWKCNGCQTELPYQWNIQEIVKRMTDLIDTELEEIKEANEMHSGIEPMNAVLRLETIINSYAGIAVYENHYVLLKVKIRLVAQVYNFLACIDSDNDLHFKMAIKLVRLAFEVLTVLNVICPGMTAIRGRVLFYLATGLLYTTKWNVKKIGKDYIKFIPEIELIVATKEESQSILHLEPLNSIDNALANALVNIEDFRSQFSQKLVEEEIQKSVCTELTHLNIHA